MTDAREAGDAQYGPETMGLYTAIMDKRIPRSACGVAARIQAGLAGDEVKNGQRLFMVRWIDLGTSIIVIERPRRLNRCGGL